MTELAKKRPEFRNINALTDLPTYRLPAAGWESILHRVSGVLMFVLMPFIIWMFDKSISSEISFAKFRSAFGNGIGFPRVAWMVRGGAKREQPYKRFLRRHQVPTAVWYKAYAGLSVADLNRNTRVREGVERKAMTESETRAWLALL